MATFDNILFKAINTGRRLSDFLKRAKTYRYF